MQAKTRKILYLFASLAVLPSTALGQSVGELTAEDAKLQEQEQLLLKQLQEFPSRSHEAPSAATSRKAQTSTVQVARSSSKVTRPTVSARPSTPHLEGSEFLRAIDQQQDFSEEIGAIQRAQARLANEVELVGKSIAAEQSELEQMDSRTASLQDQERAGRDESIDLRTRATLLQAKLSQLTTESGQMLQKQRARSRRSASQEVRYRHAYRHVSFPAYGAQLDLPIIPPRQEKNAELTYGSVTIRDDMPLAVVLTEGASLRTAPSSAAESLSSFSLGQQLAIEKRYKEWYRIVTPSGSRGWILADALLFGPSYRSLPGKFTRLKAYDRKSDRM